MALKLYEIKQEYELALEQANAAAEQNEGEIPDSLAEMLDRISLNLEEKVNSCGCAYKNLSSEADAVDAEIKRLRQRKQSLENQAEWLKRYIERNVPAGAKMSTAQCSIAWRKSQAVVITDELAVPDDYCRLIREVSKTMLKDALKQGIAVAGAKLEDRNSLQIK